MLSSEESLKILRETNALLEGHFILSSGLHSSQYVQCAQLLSKPDKARLICSSLSEKIGGKLIDLSYTRGVYDVVATVEAPNSDIMTSLKLSMMKTGAIAELTILEDIDLNAIAREGAKMIGLYKAPGN